MFQRVNEPTILIYDTRNMFPQTSVPLWIRCVCRFTFLQWSTRSQRRTTHIQLVCNLLNHS